MGYPMNQDKKPIRLYAYVDETGADARSDVFIVAVIIVDNRRDKLRERLRTIELDSYKASKKWTKATHKQRVDYSRAICQTQELVDAIFYGVTAKPTNYLFSTAQTIRRAISLAADDQAVRVTILIDGLEKSLRHDVKRVVQDQQIAVNKVRGLRDESDEFIRLADTIAGLVRAHREGKDFAVPLVQTMKRRGILREAK